MKNIVILAYEGCWAMSVCSVKDFFRIVSLLERHIGLEPGFNVEVVTVTGKPVSSASGFRIDPDKKLNVTANYDLVVIPPMEGPMLISGQWQSPTLIRWLNKTIEKGTLVLAMTTAAGFLAATGKLNGKLVATHWAFIRHLKAHFPEVDFTAHSSYICHDGLYATGSLNGGFDVLLEFVAAVKGDRFSQSCATHLLVADPGELKPLLPGYRNHRDEAIIKVQDWMERNYAATTTIQELAQMFGFSERNLKRRFLAATGASINQYLQMARLDKAKKLLISSERGVKEIAYEVGYENVSFFIRLFKRDTGVTPSGWRNGELPLGE